MKTVSFSKISVLVLLLLPSLGQAQDLSELYQKLKKSTVIIHTEETMAKAGVPGLLSNQGVGSGVVINADGDIFTASHVVNTADRIEVTFSNGEMVPAKVISQVAQADVALIRLQWKPKNEIFPAPLGNSDLVEIGNQICIIGSPYGLDYSFTVGHISGRHKTNSATGFAEMEFFQTDAAINRGNSGGPMFNMEGEVIGIVSSILSESGGFEGVGFAATSNIAKYSLVEKPVAWLGVEGYYLKGPLAKIFNLPQEGGLLIQRVVILSPADDMGLKGGTFEANIQGHNMIVGGDIVLTINGISLDTPEHVDELRNFLSTMKSGDTMNLLVLRGGTLTKLSSTMP